MSGKMTLKGLIEEELMEVKTVIDNFNERIGEVIECLNENERLDHDNDKIRANVRKFLLSALRNFNMRDFEGMNNDVHAALQRLEDQERKDLADDRPRMDARVKLSVFQSKLTGSSEMIRGCLKRINEKGVNSDEIS